MWINTLDAGKFDNCAAMHEGGSPLQSWSIAGLPCADAARTRSHRAKGGAACSSLENRSALRVIGQRHAPRSRAGPAPDPGPSMRTTMIFRDRPNVEPKADRWQAEGPADLREPEQGGCGKEGGCGKD